MHLIVHVITSSCSHRRKLVDHDQLNQDAQPKQFVLNILNDELTMVESRYIGSFNMPHGGQAQILFPERIPHEADKSKIDVGTIELGEMVS